MKLLSSVLLGVGLLCTASLVVPSQAIAAPATAQPVESVNPFIGTAEHGHTYPGATVPFGMVQLSPDSTTTGWDGSSGYHYSDSAIRGFSHTHLSGTGASGLGDVLLMPTVGEVFLNSGTPGQGYISRFSHAQEKATPGYYRVYLQDPKVTAELTATARCGMHRYTFPASDQSHIVLDLVHGIGNNPAEASLNVESSTTLSGHRVMNDWGGKRAVYFVMQFSKPFASYGIEQDGARVGGDARAAQGKNLKAFVNYQTKAGEVILAKVGISGTSVEGARKNLNAEIRGWDFDGVRTAAAKQWSEALGAVQIETLDPHIRTTFYTNLYESFLAPVLFNDVDGTYRGLDRQNHAGAGFQNYTTFSLWDTFRAEHPLLTILQPQRVPDMVNSMVAHAAQFDQHALPVWPLWGNETWCMIGYHSAPVVVDAYLKGFKGFDAEAAYQALRTSALDKRNGMGSYEKYGYVLPSDGQSVSRTLEYAYDDWCVAQMAQGLGHTEDAKYFLNRAGNYRNLYDTTVGFMRGRKANGDWRRPFAAKQLVWADYTEANAWQYTWSVMHDAPGLVKTMGGDAAFITKLDALFNEKPDVDANIPDISGLIGQYAHGNEPVHHVAYLYNSAGAPCKTQQHVREIMATLYNDTPAGQSGNNDCGQMSAWYVLSALGFYSVNPASGVYTIGSPLVNRATIHLDSKVYGGKTFTIVAQNNAPNNIYIQSARLNGKPLARSWFTHRELTAGGELRFVMGPKPNLKWGAALQNRPSSGMPSNFKYALLPTPSTNKVVALPLPIRIVAGSDDPVQAFVPDPNITSGQTANKKVAIDTSAPGAAPAEVYQSERYGKDYSFSFPVPAGKLYNVRLHFAEIFDNRAKMRVENIYLGDQLVLPNFDIFAAGGGMNKAIVKNFPGIAPDAQGNIVVRIQAVPGSPDPNAKISGIEITEQ